MRQMFMVVDPGQTSGIVWAVLNTELEHPVEMVSVAEIVTRRLGDEAWHNQYLRAAQSLDKLWRRARRRADELYQIPAADHFIVQEDFILRPVADSSRKTLSPVYISLAWEGIRMARSQRVPVTMWSMPGNQTEKVVPRAAMLKAKLWASGKPHAMSAMRHLVVIGRSRGYTGMLSPREGRIDPFFVTKRR